MKKIFFLGAALTMAFAMTSCKSSESAYKKAYEKAQAAQQQPTYNTPVAQQQTTPTQTTTVAPVQNATTTVAPVQETNVPVRTENVSLVNGPALKAYSVVVGSLSVPANASALANKLTNAGYQPRVVKADVNGTTWYRVIATSFDTKAEAVASRSSLEGQYQGAWLLYAK